MASVEEQAVSLIYMLYLMTLSSTSGILNSSSFGARMMSIAMLGLAIVFLLFIFFVCIADCPILLTSGLLIIGLANEINCLDFHNFIGKMVAYAVDATFPSAVLLIIAAIASFLAFNYVMSKVYFLLLWLYKKTKLIKIPDLSEIRLLGSDHIRYLFPHWIRNVKSGVYYMYSVFYKFHFFA